MWIIGAGLSLMGALMIVGAAWGGTLNKLYPIPVVYEFEDGTGAIVGHGEQGDIRLEFLYVPNPTGGHPDGRLLEILELDQPYPVFQGVILDDPAPIPGALRFLILDDDPFGRSTGTWTWDVPTPWSRVPQLGTGWLVVTGGLWGLGWRLSSAKKSSATAL